jgi:hypothetical protein
MTVGKTMTANQCTDLVNGPLTISLGEKPNWEGAEEFGQILAEAFAENGDGEWVDAFFPFIWANGTEPSDGTGGKPVQNPLEFRVYLKDMDGNPAVIRSYDLAAMLRDDIEAQVDRDSRYDEDGKEWATRTADALEALAREIRSHL